MLTRPTSLVVVIVVVCSACQGGASTEFTAEEQAEIKQTLTQRLSDYAVSVQQRDIAAMMDFWADVDGFVIAGDGELTVGHDVFESGIRQNIVNRPTVNHFSFTDPHVYVLGRDAASYSVRFDWSMTTTEGDTINARGSWTYVFKRFEDAWRVIHSAGTHLYS